jgi:hypothetical protein
MDTIHIPAGVISFLAFASVISIWFVRPMPLLVRVSIIVPLFYFGVLYTWVQLSGIGAIHRTDLVRFGLIGIFVTIIANSLMAIALRKKVGHL